MSDGGGSIESTSDLESISETVNASYSDEPRYQNAREKMRLTLLNGELQKTLLEASIQKVVDDSYPNRAPYRKLREEMRLTLLDAHYRTRAIAHPPPED